MTATAMSYQDYVALPDDGKRYEIHDGELCATAAPAPLHQIVSVNLLEILLAHVKARELGLVLYAPLDIILSDRPGETTILQPDIVFLERARLGLISQRAIEGPPTLAVEILSPSTAVIDRTRKRALYALRCSELLAGGRRRARHQSRRAALRRVRRGRARLRNRAGRSAPVRRPRSRAGCPLAVRPMKVVMPVAFPELMRFRALTGADRFDEMWAGVLAPSPPSRKAGDRAGDLTPSPIQEPRLAKRTTTATADRPSR